MTKEDYVTFEQDKNLKELGFPQNIINHMKNIIFRLIGSILILPLLLFQALWMLMVFFLAIPIMWIHWVYTGDWNAVKWIEKLLWLWHPIYDKILNKLGI